MKNENKKANTVLSNEKIVNLNSYSFPKDRLFKSQLEELNGLHYKNTIISGMKMIISHATDKK